MHRYLAGYQSALVVAAILVAVGVPIALWTLRSVKPTASEVENRVPELV